MSKYLIKIKGMDQPMECFEFEVDRIKNYLKTIFPEEDIEVIKKEDR